MRITTQSSKFNLIQKFGIKYHSQTFYHLHNIHMGESLRARLITYPNVLFQW